MSVRKTLLVTGLILIGLAVAPGTASAGGPPPTPLLTTTYDPLLLPSGLEHEGFMALPGSSATVTGAGVTCVNETDQVVLSVPGLDFSEVVVNPSEGISVVVPTTASTPSAIYDVDVSCLPDPDEGELTANAQAVDGIMVAKGWISVATAEGLPPSEGTFAVSTDSLVWGEECDVEGAGFDGESDVEVWMYSTPELLGTFNASATGSLVGTVVMPPGAALGSHTMVLAGRDPTGRPLFLTVGVTLGQTAGTPNSTPSTPAPAAGTPAPTAAVPGQTGGATAATLPETGGNGELALVAVGLLAVGTVALVGSRSMRRRVGVR